MGSGRESGRKEGKGREGKGREGKGREGKGREGKELNMDGRIVCFFSSVFLPLSC